MDLFDKVSEDIKTAMKAKDKVALDTLRNIKKVFLEAKTAPGANDTLADADALKIIQKLVKQGKDAAEIYVQQGRQDLADAELAQVKVMENYLPKQMSAEELETALKAIIAEVDMSRIETRHRQGWVHHITASIPEAFRTARQAMQRKEPCSIAYHGNIVDLLEYAVANNEHIELLSDQTSCHAVYEGGYCPAGVTFEERTRMLKEDREQFRQRVDESLRRHFRVVRELVDRGTYFFDYGNSFMKAIYDAGCKEISRNGVDEKDGFIFPSYVEDIMGPQLFDYGYGPFRWVCLSGKHEDLIKTDHAAMACIPKNRRGQDLDNYNWIRDAEKNQLVVGTQARILYQDALGRMNIALKFNEMVRTSRTAATSWPTWPCNALPATAHAA